MNSQLEQMLNAGRGMGGGGQPAVDAQIPDKYGLAC